MKNSSVDAVVISSGIGGLSCAALLARYGFEVVVCESHAIPGGAAHSFERDGFKFDSEPGVWAGQGILPEPKPPLRGLLCCGDSSFPGIGLPAIAVSEMIAANAIAPLSKHRKLLKALGF